MTGNPAFDYIWLQYGAVGLIIVGLLIALVYYVKKNDKKDAHIDELQEKRLQDAVASAKVTNEPFQELTNYVRTLYELSNGKKGE